MINTTQSKHMIDIEEQKKNIDRFMEDLVNAVLSEGVANGAPQEQMEQAKKAFSAVATAAKSIVGKVSPGIFAAACSTYGDALGEALNSEDEEDDEENNSNNVFEHIDEKIDTGDK